MIQRLLKIPWSARVSNNEVLRRADCERKTVANFMMEGKGPAWYMQEKAFLVKEHKGLDRVGRPTHSFELPRIARCSL